MASLTINLPAELAQALLDMAAYGAEEKLYCLDHTNHGYTEAEETEVRRFVVNARKACEMLQGQLYVGA